MNEINPLDIAIIGMSGYFPESYDLEQYWKNLSEGVCSTRFYSDEELLNRGVDSVLLNNPNYVKASPYFSQTRNFDGAFFNINPSEANIMDPQRRLFIENCWQALEDAGYTSDKYKGKIGVFGSTGINLYLLNLMSNRAIVNAVGELQIISSNDKDGLPTQTSYLLNLTGPSVNINTACSSTLVAIHLAKQSLLLGDSDMVIAGGAALIIPENTGYLYERDSILSHDGYCKAFDKDSDGTLWGSGSGAIVLKRLSDAIADHDNIRAVLKGSAINNDGANKVGYTAPSMDGQTEVLVQAYASADISPETINYIEAHGTGTKIGDPIEIAALTAAFREYTQKKQYCGIGSVKTNIGHLGAAAGIASVIKAVLALENRKIPPSLHFKEANPNIDFANSPFYVNTELKDMKDVPYPLRIGVSSLGVGGTNAHLILEEYKNDSKRVDDNINPALILLSARNEEQLKTVKTRLLDYLVNNQALSIYDVAYTLQIGRRDFKSKLAFTTFSTVEAIEILKNDSGRGILNNNNYLEKIQEVHLVCKESLEKWFQNTMVDWGKVYSDHNLKRVGLPTYPFEKIEHWVEAAYTNFDSEDDMLAHKDKDMEKWFYHNSWAQTAIPPMVNKSHYQASTRLIFLDQSGVGYKVGNRLEEIGDKVIFVSSGKVYKKKDVFNYQINLDNYDSYQMMIKDLIADNNVPDSILHLMGLNGADKKSFVNKVKSIYSFQKYGLFSFIYLTKALTSNNITKEISLIPIVRNIFDISGNETVSYEKSVFLSATKVIQQEYPSFHNRTIEIDNTFFSNRGAVELLVQEILNKKTDILCAYRGSKRWILDYRQITIKAEVKESVFKEKGVYFAFGGLTGGIPAIYEYLIKEYNAKLIIIDDSYFPKMKDWDQWLKEHNSNEVNSLKIKTARKLIEMGVEYIDDVDIIYGQSKLAKKIKDIESKYGVVSGLIHAAGGYAAGRMAPLSISESDLKNLALYNLSAIPVSFMLVNEFFKNRKLDFRTLWTSLSTVLAGPGFISYCASDAIVTAVALDVNKKLDEPWSIINWDSLESEWNEDTVEENMVRGFPVIKERIMEGLIKTEEGNKCLEILLGVNKRFNPMVISCSDLHKRYKIWVENDIALNNKKSRTNMALKARPKIDTLYEEPVSEFEKLIAVAMGDILNIRGIGRKDNFFELGGNSLVAIQFATKLREISQRDIGMDKIFEYQNVSELAEYLSK